MLSRSLYIIFYVAYLVTIAIFLWFVFSYTDVPSWVFILFAFALGIIIVSIIVKEFFIKSEINEDGTVLNDTSVRNWTIGYWLLYIIAIALIAIGTYFVVTTSSIPWWIWCILILAIILDLISSILMVIGSLAVVFAVLIAFLALMSYIIGIIFFIIYSDAPWWVWAILAIAIVFSIVANTFETMANKNEYLTTKKSTKESPPPTQPLSTQPLYAQPPYAQYAQPPYQTSTQPNYTGMEPIQPRNSPSARAPLPPRSTSSVSLPASSLSPSLSTGPSTPLLSTPSSTQIKTLSP